MKILKTHKKVAVASLALTVALLGGGVAFAYFESGGTGTGTATVGSPASVTVNQLSTASSVVYDSINSPGYAADFAAQGIAEYGNQISLASTSSGLSSVTVSMANFSQTAFNVPITFDIYSVGTDNAVGSLITSDTQSFSIPAATTYVPAAGSYVITFNITFNDFSPSDVVLPSNVIYGISFSTTTDSSPNENGGGTQTAASALAVGQGIEQTDVSVGSDPLLGTGSDYIDIVTSGYYPDNYCDGGAGGVNNGFRYDPGTGGDTPCVYPNFPVNGSGENGSLPDDLVPAVQFNETSASSDVTLYPGGAAQPIDFSVTNNSSTESATVTSVSVAVDQDSLPAGCAASWFTVVQPTIPSAVTIPAGGSVDFQPSGSIVELQNEPFNQDACEGATVGLTFTAS